MTEKPKSKRVSMSKRKLAQTAEEMEFTATVADLAGAVQASEGAQKIKLSETVASAGAVEIAAGASDLTRAVDAGVVSDRLSKLSEVVATAGVVDVAEGAKLLAASEDVGVMSALIGLMSMEDVEHGLELARLAGEFTAVSMVITSLQMPLLSLFLEDRGNRLQEMAVEQIRLAGSTRSLGRAMAATGVKIAGMGEDEIAEGMARMAVSEGMVERSADLAVASEILAEKGTEEISVAIAASEIAKELAEQGASEMAAGAAQMGAAAAMEDFASTLSDKAQ